MTEHRGGPRVCDYEGSPYRVEFWENANRAYEDAVDRQMIAELLPPHPGRLVEIGAGYGRLLPQYRAADEVILLDYARSMLEDAADRVPPGVRLVCADLYRLPFARGAIDTVVQVRVLHHVEDVPSAFVEVARVLSPGGSFVLEYANKRNAKAIARWLAKDEAENPFDMRPYEFVELNWNFHPSYVGSALKAAGLTPRESRSASHLRAAPVKERVPADLMARADQILGRLFGGMAPGPSQFVRAAKLEGAPPTPGLWRCPSCGNEPLVESAEGIPCDRCGRLWPIVGRLILMREPYAIRR